MKTNPAILLLVIFSISVTGSSAQESGLFMPVEIQKAYEKGTRSFDGQPGVNYWHNTADYKIKVRFIPSEKLIEGYEEVVYHNNSPDEITTLVVRLYNDVYKIGNPRLYPIHVKDIDEGVELTEVAINEVPCDPEDPDLTNRSGTNIKFRLKMPLKPGSELTFRASWKQKLPSYSKFRTGAYDSSAFFVAYWYPQIAVYDDIFGWDELDYLIRTEFYNNLGNFDVEISVPEEYVVWATGTLVNAGEVLPEDIFRKYQSAWSSEETTHIISIPDLENGFKSLYPTWHYRASEVTDFAFALSDHHIWDAVTLPLKERKVLISSVQPADTVVIMSGHADMQKKAMLHFSEDIPGIPYPYEAFTTFIVKGAGGMEYPMMANNGGTDRRTTLHEMFHTYFPMYVRTNERRWAWMDEGWANYNTLLTGNRFFENDYEASHVFQSTLGLMGSIADLPLMTSSQFLMDPAYRYASYQAPEMVYAILHHYLGDELFLTCYREYITRWAKKSPTPYDFFYTFENVSGKELNWLWKPWFFEFGVADIAVQSVENGKLNIINQGNKPVPLFIEFRYKNGDRRLVSENASIWANGKKEMQVTIPDHENIIRISVNKMITDADPADNFVPSLLSLYQEIEKTEGLPGDYMIEGYSIIMSITSEDGLFYASVPYLNVSVIIYPTDKLHFSSLDDSMGIKFNLNESGECTDIDIDWNGHFNAKKLR